MGIKLLCFIFVFSCFIVNCKTKQKCPAPFSPMHGEYKDKRSDYIPDDIITYSCTNGTYLYGSKVRKCNADGAWNATTPYCATTIIEEIFDTARGMILQNLTDRNYDSCISLTNPITLAFSNVRNTTKITLRIVWKAQKNAYKGDVEMNRIACEKTSRHTHSLSSFNEYTCSPNIKTNKRNIYLPNWTSRELCEVEIFTERDEVCPQLSMPNGNVRYESPSSSLSYGTVASIQCNEGYKISRGGQVGTFWNDFRYCADGGKWMGRNNSCEKVQCSELGPVENGNIEYHNIAKLKLAKLRCDEGYKPVANAEVTCQLDGTWALHDFKCCPLRCYSPPTLKNGMMWIKEKDSMDNATVGTKARLHCQPGFTKTSGQFYIECLKTGKWSTTNSTCRSVNDSKRKVVVIAASVGAISSALVFACIFGCILLLRRRLKRRQLPDSRLPLNEIEERRVSTEKHEYSVVVYEEIHDMRKKKPTSPLPKIPSDESEFNYSLPIDQRKCPYVCASDYNQYTEPDDAFKLDSSSLKTRTSIKRRNSSADSSYWRENSIGLSDIYISNVPKLRKIGSNTSLPDFPANKCEIYENDLYSSD